MWLQRSYISLSLAWSYGLNSPQVRSWWRYCIVQFLICINKSYYRQWENLKPCVAFLFSLFGLPLPFWFRIFLCWELSHYNGCLLAKSQGRSMLLDLLEWWSFADPLPCHWHKSCLLCISRSAVKRHGGHEPGIIFWIFFFYLPRRVFLLRRLPSPKPQMSEPVEEKRNLQYCLHMVDLRFFIPSFHSPWNASLTDQLKPQEPIQITMLN